MVSLPLFPQPTNLSEPAHQLVQAKALLQDGVCHVPLFLLILTVPFDQTRQTWDFISNRGDCHRFLRCDSSILSDHQGELTLSVFALERGGAQGETGKSCKRIEPRWSSSRWGASERVIGYTTSEEYSVHTGAFKGAVSSRWKDEQRAVV